jgi:hypothetical protein
VKAQRPVFTDEDLKELAKLPVYTFEEKIKLIGMTFTALEQYNVIKTDGGTYGGRIYDCDNESCPLRRLKLLDAKLEHLNGKCRILIYLSGVSTVRYGRMIKERKDLFGDIASMSYNRIKSNFKYGKRGVSASEQEIEDLKMMVTHYPRDSAKVLFNADYMLVYPLDFEGLRCENKYTCGRTVVFSRNGLDVFLYFVMTDESIKDFDNYLSEIRHVFWFDDENTD